MIAVANQRLWVKGDLKQEFFLGGQRLLGRAPVLNRIARIASRKPSFLRFECVCSYDVAVVLFSEALTWLVCSRVDEHMGRVSKNRKMFAEENWGCTLPPQQTDRPL